MSTLYSHKVKVVLLFAFAAMVASCVPYKELLILNEGDQLDGDSLRVAQLPGSYIQTDDRLLIQVSAFNPETAAPFNQNLLLGENGSGNAGLFNNQNTEPGNNLNEVMIGYMVDTNGNIEFPVLGTVEVRGLTIEEAKRKMYGQLDPYLTNYSVDIQIINRRMTVSGEVGRPGVVELERNKMTTLEAIERAGGFTGFSKRTNVLIIREIDNQRTYARINFQDRDWVNSPYYYAQPNDVIYVEPLKQKRIQVSEALIRSVTVFTSLVSAIAVILALAL